MTAVFRFRQGVSFTNAEDLIGILTTDVPAAPCVANCFVTRDFWPLVPGMEENKYYAPGIGKSSTLISKPATA